MLNLAGELYYGFSDENVVLAHHNCYVVYHDKYMANVYWIRSAFEFTCDGKNNVVFRCYCTNSLNVKTEWRCTRARWSLVYADVDSCAVGAGLRGRSNAWLGVWHQFTAQSWHIYLWLKLCCAVFALLATSVNEVAFVTSDYHCLCGKL